MDVIIISDSEDEEQLCTEPNRNHTSRDISDEYSSENEELDIIGNEKFEASHLEKPKKPTIHVPEDNGGKCSASTSRQFTTIVPNREEHVKSIQKMDTIIMPDSVENSFESDHDASDYSDDDAFDYSDDDAFDYSDHDTSEDSDLDTSEDSDLDTSEEESEEKYGERSEEKSGERSKEGPPMKKAKMDTSRDDGGECSSALIRQFSQEIIDETGVTITVFPNKEKLVEELQNNYWKCNKGKINSSKSTCIVVGCNKSTRTDLCAMHLYIYKEIVYLTYEPVDPLLKHDTVPDVGIKKELALKMIRAKLQASTTSRVYVGITNNFETRMRQHKKTKQQDSEEVLIKCDSKHEACLLEYEVIAQLSKELKHCRIVNKTAGGTHTGISMSKKMVLYALYFNEPDPNWNEPKYDYTNKMKLNASLRQGIFDLIKYQLPTLQCMPSKISVMKLLGLECIETPRLKAKKAKRLDVLARIDRLVCPACKKSFHKAKATVKHFQKRHKNYEGRIECDVCSKIFPSHTAHCKHFCGEVDPSIHLLTCPACKKSFSTPRNTVSHFQKRHKNYEGRIECDVCSKIFPYQMSLSSHVCKVVDPSNDPSIDLLTCPACKKSFSTPASTVSHFQEHHKDYEGKFECDVCSKIFPYQMSLSSHVCKVVDPSNDPSIDLLTCPACKKSFSTPRHTVSHFQDKHKNYEGKFECDVCSKIFPYQMSLSSHICKVVDPSNDPSIDPLICPACKKSCSTPKSTVSHFQNKHKNYEGKFKCDVCSKIFPYQMSLSSHVCKVVDPSNDPSIDPLICPACKESFGQAGSTIRHFQVRHKNYEGKFKCDVCSKIFPYQMSLSSHICKVVDPSIDPLICPACKKSFSTPKATVSHFQNMHKNYEGRFECDVCSKIFPYQMSLSSHICKVVDPSNDPLICPACKKSFSTPWHTVSHFQNKHKNYEGRFECDVCSKIFPYQMSLSSHMCKVLDPSNDPSNDLLICPACKKSFSTPRVTVKHFQQRHKDYEGKFKCDVCSKIFPYQMSLSSHICKVVDPSNE